MKKIELEFEASKRELLDGKYLEYDQEWGNLFLWLRENVSVDNFVSQSMEESIKDKEIEGEIDGIEMDFPGIFEVREGDVKRAEDQLEFLNQAEKEYREQSSQLGKILEQVNEELQELSKQSADNFANSEIWSEKVEDTKTELTSLTNQEEEDMKRLMETYKNPEELLTSDLIPIDMVKMKMSVSGKRLETCMRTFNTDGSSKESQNMSAKIEYFAQNTLDLYEKVLEERTNVAGMESALEMMDKFSEFSPTDDINSQMTEKCQMFEIFEDDMEDLTAECEAGKRNEVMREKQIIYTKAQQIKLKRAQDRVERLKEIDQLTEKVTNIGELMWILLQVDNNKMKHFLSILGRDEKSSLEDFLWNIDQESLSSVVSNCSITPRKPLMEYVLDPKRNVELLEKFSEFHKVEKILKSLMLGPAKTPIMMTPQMSFKHHLLNNLAVQNESLLKEIRDRFVKEYREPKASNKLWTYRRLLWVWFLIQPKNVLMAIECVSKEAIKKLTAKSLPGIQNH